MRQGIVNEDDLLEIKQDISSLRLVYTIHALLTEFAQFVCITTLKVQRWSSFTSNCPKQSLMWEVFILQFFTDTSIGNLNTLKIRFQTFVIKNIGFYFKQKLVHVR